MEFLPRQTSDSNNSEQLNHDALAEKLKGYIRHGNESMLEDSARLYDEVGAKKLPEALESIADEIIQQNSNEKFDKDNFPKIFARQIQPACRKYLFIDPDILPPILKDEIQKQLGLDQEAYKKCNDFKKAQLADAIASAYMAWMIKAIKDKLPLNTDNNGLDETIKKALREDRERRTALNEMLYQQSSTLPYVFTREKLKEATNPRLQEVKGNKEKRLLVFLDQDFKLPTVKETQGTEGTEGGSFASDFYGAAAFFIQMDCCHHYTETELDSKLNKVFGKEYSKGVKSAYDQNVQSLLTMLILIKNSSTKLLPPQEAAKQFAVHLYKKGKDNDFCIDIIKRPRQEEKSTQEPVVCIPGSIQYRWRFDKEHKRFQLEWCAVENALQASCFYRDCEKDPITQEEVSGELSLEQSFLKLSNPNFARVPELVPMYKMYKEYSDKSFAEEYKKFLLSLKRKEYKVHPKAATCVCSELAQKQFLFILKNLTEHATKLEQKGTPKSIDKAERVKKMVCDLNKEIGQQNDIALVIKFNNTIKKNEKDLAIPRRIWQPILLNIVILPITIIYAIFVGLTAKKDSLAKQSGIQWELKLAQYLIGGRSHTQQMLEESKAALPRASTLTL